MEIFWNCFWCLIGMIIMCIVYLGFPYLWKKQLYKRIFDTSDIGYVEKYIYSQKQNQVFKPFSCTIKDLISLNEKTHIINGALEWSLRGTYDIDSERCYLIITNNLHLHYRYKGNEPSTDKIINNDAYVLIQPHPTDT